MTAQLISFVGAPGVGKTTLARRLSQEKGIYFFEREVVLDAIFGDERDTPRYNEWAGHITKSTWIVGVDNARRGVSSIVEAPMKPAIQGGRAGFIDSALEAAAKDGFGLSLIYCTAPTETVLAYLKQRGALRDEPKYNSQNQETGWPWFLKTFIDVPGPTQYEHLRVDTRFPVEENLQKIVSYINHYIFYLFINKLRKLPHQLFITLPFHINKLRL